DEATRAPSEFYNSQILPRSFLSPIPSPAITATSISAATSIATGSSAPASARTVLLARFFGGPAFQHGLTREANLPLRVNVGHHHGDLLAHADHVLHFVDALGSELRNVDQSIQAGQDF